MKSLGLIVFVAACSFQASPQATPPDSNGGGGGGLDAGTPPGDDSGTQPPPPDAQTCFGKGVLKLCLKAPPSGDKAFATANFNTDGASCSETLQQTNGPELCVVAAQHITVTGTMTATGNRALVLIASDSITIAAGGTIDVSSRTNQPGARRGAAANTGTCSTLAHGTSDTGGAGGGAGGSLGTTGGAGGTGDKNNNGAPSGNAPGTGPGATQSPAVLRGGCPGGAGGDDSTDAARAGGAGGDGGGAVYLIAGATITVDGNVFASGGGGDPAGVEEGGGGGGTGGMIGLDAAALQLAGKIVANGGGGGGGGALDRGGSPGGDGPTVNWNTQADAGRGAQSSGGDGGDGAKGACVNATANLGGSDSDGGGGGGGGGLGLIWTWGTITGGTMMSPAPVTH